MNIFKNSFRLWWQPPRRAGDRIEHRQVTFLELFYDLVYVAVIAELSHSLSARLLPVARFTETPAAEPA